MAFHRREYFLAGAEAEPIKSLSIGTLTCRAARVDERVTASTIGDPHPGD
jgi:hypothetical protein